MKKLTKQQEESHLVSKKVHKIHSFNYCAIRSTLNVLGSKWKLLILVVPDQQIGALRELLRLIADISGKRVIGSCANWKLI